MGELVDSALTLKPGGSCGPITDSTSVDSVSALPVEVPVPLAGASDSIASSSFEVIKASLASSISGRTAGFSDVARSRKRS